MQLLNMASSSGEPILPYSRQHQLLRERIMLHLLGILLGMLVCAWVLPYVIPFAALLIAVLGVALAAACVMRAIQIVIPFDWGNDLALLLATCASFLVLFLAWRLFVWKLRNGSTFSQKTHN
jgi:hypothetical protein